MPGIVLATIIVIPLIFIGLAVVVWGLTYSPRRITYLSPEALDIKHQEIEAIRLDSVSRAYTQEDIDNANATCDELYKNYKVKGGKRG